MVPYSEFLNSSQSDPWKSQVRSCDSLPRFLQWLLILFRLKVRILHMVDKAFSHMPSAFFDFWPHLRALSLLPTPSHAPCLNTQPLNILGIAALGPLVLSSSWVLFPHIATWLTLLTSFKSLLKYHLLTKPALLPLNSQSFPHPHFWFPLPCSTCPFCHNTCTISHVHCPHLWFLFVYPC